ncbi:RDD family protein [Dinghuibacter silviterrae]|uniref:RDD family protein n=1 Tax=Dinghuibacter silviterrae TaxID=1539049 RepID=A0A4R8DPQ5_9BACT|nr:RDD family protein [Dinghuibacter silviterrae]TDW99707.1 RDD family protein [Dinghuibacter silviterrae]
MEQPAFSSAEEKSAFTTELENLLEETAAPPVTTGIRFANFIIDYLVYAMILYIIRMITIGAQDQVARVDFSFGFQFGLSYLGNLGIYALYYTIMEGTTGRSIGKFCTNTIVVKDTGAKITMKDALLRSLSRIVPFEVFTGFGTPWHDSWTHTTVVSNKKR